MADTGILYGETATYKTTNAGFAAEWFYEATQGSTGRLISADAQGWTILQPYVDIGILEPYNLLSSDEPEFALRKLSMGYWPAAGNPNGPLVKPAQSPFGPGKVGWYIVDTLAGIGDCLMHRLRQTGQQIGQDVVGKWTVKSGGEEEKFCNNPPAHYGWVQRETLSWMRDMSGMPVASILYISHETKGEAEDNKLPIRGPSLVGTAATARIPKDLGYCIHMEAYAQEEEEPGTKIKRSVSLVRGFFENHPDPTFPNIMYKCNARVPVGGMTRLKERWPNGYFVAGREHGLDEFLRLRYEVAKELSGSKTAWRAQVDSRLKGDK